MIESSTYNPLLPWSELCKPSNQLGGGNFIKLPYDFPLRGPLSIVILLFLPYHKKYSEPQKLANLMETKDNKMVMNIETHWITMHNLAQCVMSEYKILLAKWQSIWRELGKRLILRLPISIT